MILKALYDYYDRCDGLAPNGMKHNEIAFLIVIDKKGNFVRFEDRRIDEKNCQKFLVAKAVSRTGKNFVANLLWDKGSYVLGLSDENFLEDQLKEKLEGELSDKDRMKFTKKLEVDIPKAKERNETCIECFVKKVDEIHKLFPSNERVTAVWLFYQQKREFVMEQIMSDSLWETIQRNLTKYFSFLIDGETKIVAEDKAVINGLLEINCDDEEGAQSKSICLITGEKCIPVRTTTATPIPGSDGGKLVSFNIRSGDSYGKSQGYNAPISNEAEFKYTTALLRLLGTDSKNKFYIGSRTYVFWASTNTEASSSVESCLFNLFGSQTKDDDPDRHIDEVKKVFNDIYSGLRPTNSDDRFYILGLAPCKGRIAVVYWSEQSLKEFAKHILQHFEDMEIVDRRKEVDRKPYAGIHTMMATITLGGKSSDVQPNLPDAVIRSIMQGIPYPEPLFASCIRRIRAEQKQQKVSIARVSILKAYLNRLNNNHKKIKCMLDKENINQGYLCGRLFAVLEKIQEESQKKGDNFESNQEQEKTKSSTICDRYMNAASATPTTVFATLLNLSAHHGEKLDYVRRVFFEKLKGEIMDKISPEGFPSHLDLNNQGRFFVGYYHQRQDFFKRRSECEEQVNNG